MSTDGALCGREQSPANLAARATPVPPAPGPSLETTHRRPVPRIFPSLWRPRVNCSFYKGSPHAVRSTSVARSARMAIDPSAASKSRSEGRGVIKPPLCHRSPCYPFAEIKVGGTAPASSVRRNPVGNAAQLIRRRSADAFIPTLAPRISTAGDTSITLRKISNKRSPFCPYQSALLKAPARFPETIPRLEIAAPVCGSRIPANERLEKYSHSERGVDKKKKKKIVAGDLRGGVKRVGEMFVPITREGRGESKLREAVRTSAHPYESLDILPSTPIESPYKRLGGPRAQPLIRPNLKYTFHFSTVVAVPLYP